MEITDVNTLFGAFPSRHPDNTAETLVAAMQASGVDYALTISTSGLFHHDTTGNRETMNACRRLEQLIPVATVDPRGYFGQVDAIQLLAAGYEMFRFFPHDQRWPFEYAPFQDIVDAVASTRKPLMISVRAAGDVTRVARVVGAIPVAVILEGVSPDTLSEAISVMRKHERIYVETHALRGPGALDLLRDTVGIHRVLFGTYGPGLSVGAALRYVRGSGLSEADQAMVLSGSAARIWQGGEA